MSESLLLRILDSLNHSARCRLLGPPPLEDLFRTSLLSKFPKFLEILAKECLLASLRPTARASSRKETFLTKVLNAASASLQLPEITSWRG